MALSAAQGRRGRGMGGKREREACVERWREEGGRERGGGGGSSAKQSGIKKHSFMLLTLAAHFHFPNPLKINCLLSWIVFKQEFR